MRVVTKLNEILSRPFLPSNVFSFGVDFDSDVTRPEIYLTFDDGPDENGTPRVLDQLERLDIYATFFVEGAKAARHPQLIHQITDAGHTIGSHTWSHHSVSEVSNKVWLEDVQKARSLLEDLLGTACPLFRAPYGHYNPIVVKKLLSLDYQFIHWTHDSRDYNMNADSELVDYFSNKDFSKPSIVLMHDNHAPASNRLFDAVKSIQSDIMFSAIPKEGFPA